MSPGPGGMLSSSSVCDSIVVAQCVFPRVSVARAILVSHSPDHNMTAAAAAAMLADSILIRLWSCDCRLGFCKMEL